MPIVLKSGSLKLLEPSGPVQACNGIALPFTVKLKEQCGVYERRASLLLRIDLRTFLFAAKNNQSRKKCTQIRMSAVFVLMKTGLSIENYEISNLRKIHSVAFEFLDAAERQTKQRTNKETNRATNKHRDK